MARRKIGEVERVLRKARKLIEVGWTRYTFHRRIGKRDCYCPWGAVHKASGGLYYESTYNTKPMDVLREACGGVYIPAFNDAQKSKLPVLAMFDRAIAKAAQEGV